MGIKFSGPICSACKSLIEGTNFFVCNHCKNPIHNTEYCRALHQKSCIRSQPNINQVPDNVDRSRLPDVRDIFK